MRQIILIVLFLSFCTAGYGHGVLRWLNKKEGIMVEHEHQEYWQNKSLGPEWVSTQAIINRERLVYLQYQIDELKAEVAELRKLANTCICATVCNGCLINCECGCQDDKPQYEKDGVFYREPIDLAPAPIGRDNPCCNDCKMSKDFCRTSQLATYSCDCECEFDQYHSIHEEDIDLAPVPNNK